MFPSNADIRKFIQNYFSDSELEIFCFDYFPEVSDEFTAGMLKSNKILLLLTYCQRRELVDNLLAALREERLKLFDNEFSSVSVLSENQQAFQMPNTADQVFICYASEDLELALRLVNSLQTEGYRVWIAPESIYPGEKWVSAINRGLQESNIFILLLTPAAVNSRWVKSETDIAIDMEHRGEIKIIPLMAKTCSLPPIWRAYQYIPFSSIFERGLTSLLIESKKPSDEATSKKITEEQEAKGNLATLLDNSAFGDLAWHLPKIDDLLDLYFEPLELSGALIRLHVEVIEHTLESLDAPATVVEINSNPSVIQYCLEPSYYETGSGSRKRTKYEDITALSVDLAVAIATSEIQIYLLPKRGLIAIDVPNSRREIIGLRDIAELVNHKNLNSTLSIWVGLPVSGKPLVSNLVNLQNILLVGRSGSGRSVFLDTIISALLLQNSPRDLRLMLIDPRMELIHYRNIPHIVGPKEANSANITKGLKWILNQVELRILKFEECRVTNLSAYNLTTDDYSLRLPNIAVCISELSDLVASDKDAQHIIQYISRMALKTGVHVIASTRNPTVDVINESIQSSFPSRFLFSLRSKDESIRLLGRPGAERLLGKGDMMAILPNQESPIRIQGPYISENEVEKITDHWCKFSIS